MNRAGVSTYDGKTFTPLCAERVWGVTADFYASRDADPERLAEAVRAALAPLVSGGEVTVKIVATSAVSACGGPSA